MCEASGFDLVRIIEEYKVWVVVPFYVAVSGYNEYTKEYDYAAFRSPKRGDRKYSRRTLGRFQNLESLIADVKFFSFGERDRNKISSPCVFVTLTYDTSVCSIEDSWLNVGLDFNRWITRLRRRFGKIEAVRGA